MTRHTLTVDVPPTRRIEIQLPPDVPVGPTTLEVTATPVPPTEFTVPQIEVGSLPRFFDSRSGKWRLVGRSGVVREIGNGS